MTSEENKRGTKAAIEKPDWTIEELYRKAWQIVKNNKILWVFGAAIGAATSFNFNSSLDKSDTKWLQKIFEGDPQQGQELTRVLGAVTSRSDSIISQLFSAVPPYLWILLGLEFFLLVLFGIFVSLLYKSWATGALLDNLERCIKGGKATIREASEKAFTILKPLLWLQIIPVLILTIGSVAVIVLLGTGIAFAPGLLKAIFGLLLFGFMFFLVYAWIMLTASLIWATRQVATGNKGAKEALRSGYNIAKKKFWSILLLGFVNNILVAIVIGIPIVMLIGIIIGGFFAYQSIQSLGIGIFIIGGLLLFTLIIAGIVVGGILNAFKASVWSLAYNNIKGKYEKR